MRAVSLLLLSVLIASCTTAQKPAPQTRIAAKKKEGPATKKVRERQEQMQDEMDFTLGEPLSPRVRSRMNDDRFTKSYGRPR